MKKKAFFLLIIVFFSNLWTHLASSNIYISVTVDDEIITNHDIKKESEYLKVLNPQLSQLNNDKILKLAKNSLINEIIKKKEISKFIDISKENDFVQNYLNNLYLRLNFENEESFKKELLKNNNYTLNQIKQKIKIELFWNELIYSKYKNQLRIDEKKLKNKINKIKDKNQKEYFISEIVFNKKQNETLEKLVEKINLSINEIGFNNTANIFSISESGKLGGKLGWVNENSLSKLISEKLNTLNEGEITDMIKIGNNFLIIKVDQIRISEIKINKDKELKKLIQAEKNKQLNQFSRIYFGKSKISYIINEK